MRSLVANCLQFKSNCLNATTLKYDGRLNAWLYVSCRKVFM